MRKFFSPTKFQARLSNPGTIVEFFGELHIRSVRILATRHFRLDRMKISVSANKTFYVDSRRAVQWKKINAAARVNEGKKVERNFFFSLLFFFWMISNFRVFIVYHCRYIVVDNRINGGLFFFLFISRGYAIYAALYYGTTYFYNVFWKAF